MVALCPVIQIRQLLLTGYIGYVRMISALFGGRRERWVLVGCSSGGYGWVSFFWIVAALACTLPWQRGEGPNVVIDRPSQGAVVKVGEEVLIQSTATDARGVTRVELWVDGNLVHTDFSPVEKGQTPFSVLQPWMPMQAGGYEVVIKAYNVAGQVGESEPIIITAVEAIAEASPTPGLEAAATPTPVVESPTPTHTGL